MGTGIGKDCEICGEQLDMSTGYNQEETLCDKCVKLIPRVLDYLARRGQ